LPGKPAGGYLRWLCSAGGAVRGCPRGLVPSGRRDCRPFLTACLLSADPAADTSELEREFDRIVYKVYGLMDEEIAIVEGAAGKGEK